MFNFSQNGDFSKTLSFLNNNESLKLPNNLDSIGKAGVAALSAATPVDSGETATSWYYDIVKTKNTTTISFYNSNIQNGIPIAILLQYGHGTKNGGWVKGTDYINPAIKPIFDKLSQQAWEEVIK